MLLKKLKNQVILALVQFLLTTAIVILLAYWAVLSFKFTDNNGTPDFNIISTNTTVLLKWVSRALSLIFFITWIMGIVNSVQINNITNDSIVLIVMSVITLYFGHLWAACYQLKKHKNAEFGII